MSDKMEKQQKAMIEAFVDFTDMFLSSALAGIGYSLTKRFGYCPATKNHMAYAMAIQALMHAYPDDRDRMISAVRALMDEWENKDPSTAQSLTMRRVSLERDLQLAESARRRFATTGATQGTA